MPYDLRTVAVWNLDNPVDLPGGVVSENENAQGTAQRIAEAARVDRASENPIRELTDPITSGIAYDVEASEMEAFENRAKELGLSTQDFTDD
jgi:hypothetical protein